LFNKLRANYSLSNVLIRILFVLTFVFCNWQEFLGVVVSMNGVFASGGVAFSGSVKLFLALMSAALLGTILMFVVPLLANLFLNVAKIYSVPRAEYCLLVHLFCSIGFLICGLLNLINLFTPVLLVWGGVIFPFAVAAGCSFAFYKVTAKLYFNDVTVVNYFKYSLIAFAVLAFLLEVL